MWTNVGAKLQKLAKIVCWIGIICSVIGAIVSLAVLKMNFFSVLAQLVLGCLSAWIGSLATYGLGVAAERAEKEI